MSQQVVVEGGVLTTPDATIAVGTLVVDGVAEALRQYAPLQGEVLNAVERAALIDTPADGAVVDDDIAGLAACMEIGIHRIVLVAGGVTHAATDEAHDDIARGNAETVVLQTDAIARSRLAPKLLGLSQSNQQCALK